MSEWVSDDLHVLKMCVTVSLHVLTLGECPVHYELASSVSECMC